LAAASSSNGRRTATYWREKDSIDNLALAILDVLRWHRLARTSSQPRKHADGYVRYEPADPDLVGLLAACDRLAQAWEEIRLRE
jgi:hypothetical protein